MRDFFEGAVPCCGFILVFGILFGFMAFMRYLNYRETIILAEKGLVKPPERGNGRWTLFWGIGLTSVGLALCLGLLPLGFFIGDRNPFGMFGPWLLPGMLPMFLGLGLVLYYVLTRESQPGPKGGQLASAAATPAAGSTSLVNPVVTSPPASAQPEAIVPDLPKTE